jgi:hypothetical protein
MMDSAVAAAAAEEEEEGNLAAAMHVMSGHDASPQRDISSHHRAQQA